MVENELFERACARLVQFCEVYYHLTTSHRQPSGVNIQKLEEVIDSLVSYIYTNKGQV